MRDVNRIPELCKILESVWMEFPDWRFGQFISNFIGWCVSTNKCVDIFFPEDNEWQEWLQEYVCYMKGKGV